MRKTRMTLSIALSLLMMTSVAFATDGSDQKQLQKIFLK